MVTPNSRCGTLPQPVRGASAILVVALLGACGGTVGVGAGLASTADAGKAGDAGDDAAVDSATPEAAPPTSACGTLSLAGPIQQVSDPEPNTSHTLGPVAAGQAGALVGWTTGAGPQDPVHFAVRTVGVDGAPTSAVSTPFAATQPDQCETVSLAQGFGRVGALASFLTADRSSALCAFLPLDANGAPAAAAPVVSSWWWCGSLRATKAGFDAIAIPISDNRAVSLVNLDPGRGQSISMPLSPGLTPIQVSARATFDDGSFLLAWSPALFDDCNCSVTLSVEHFSSSGQPLAPRRMVGDVWPGAQFALATLGGGAILAWAPAYIANAPGILVAPVDFDGNPTRSTVQLGRPPSTSVTSVDLAVWHDDKGQDVSIVGWVERSSAPGSAMSWQALAQAVSASDGVPSAPVAVALSATVATLHVAATPRGALVLFNGLPTTTSASEVSAVPLACGP
jgi:hypothetical protein